MKAVNIGLLGLGTVGSGVLEILRRNADEITRRAGREIKVSTAAVRDKAKPRGFDTRGIVLTEDPIRVIDDPDIDIVVELIGGETVALDSVMRAMANGKYVVTANKALIAIHGNQIFEKAQTGGLMVAFESAVAGGIPIIKSIREGLAANRIQWLAGIINGTSNYILTQMEESGRDFSEVLGEAQSLGYAEADPSFDIGGIDAAHKLTILASIAFGISLQFEKVFVEGITNVTSADIAYAKEFGYRIKHLGIARRTKQGIELRVHPVLIPRKRLIANVNGVMNAVLVHADAVGPTLYYGAGAGSEPTASAVVADLVDVVRAITTDPDNRVPHLAFQSNALQDTPVLPIGEVRTAHYLRMSVINRPGVLALITRILGDKGISIETILQKGTYLQAEATRPDDRVTILLMTQEALDKDIGDAIDRIEQLETVYGQVTHFRVENLS